jgi:hypothetical protein
LRGWSDGEREIPNWLLKVTPERRAAAEREFGQPITTLSADGRLVRDHTPGPAFPIRYAAVGVSACRRAGAHGHRLQRVHPRRPPRGHRAGDRHRAPDLDAAAAPRKRESVGLRPLRAVYRPGGRHLMEDVVGIVAGSFSMADTR